MDLKSVETEAKTVAEADLGKAKTWLWLSGPHWVGIAIGCGITLLVVAVLHKL